MMETPTYLDKLKWKIFLSSYFFNFDLDVSMLSSRLDSTDSSLLLATLFNPPAVYRPLHLDTHYKTSEAKKQKY